MTAHATVFICISCRRQIGEGADAFDHPGPLMAERVAALLANDPAITVTPVECLAVCKRPCTVALAGDNKWTYIVGDLDNGTHVAEVAAAARAYAASSNGIVPWRERPLSFRKGVISRVPPIGFVQPEAAE